MAQAGAPEFSSQVQSLHRSCSAVNVNAFNVLIADDSPSIRQVVRSHLEQNPDWYVCGEAENGYTVVELVRQLKPDGVVLDFSMPDEWTGSGSTDSGNLPEYQSRFVHRSRWRNTSRPCSHGRH